MARKTNTEKKIGQKDFRQKDFEEKFFEEKNFEKKFLKDICLLDDYLSRYRICMNKKEMLENRIVEIRTAFTPLKAMRYDSDRVDSSVSSDTVALSLVVRIDEIESKIKEQLEQAKKFLLEIMEIIELLPPTHIERSILENRYIDRMTWDEVAAVNCYSRSQVIRYWKTGLVELSKFARTKKILEAEGMKKIEKKREEV